jgi:hypothetical protein
MEESFWAAMALYAIGFYMGYRFHKKHGVNKDEIQ